MKKYICIAFLSFFSGAAYTQTLNWATLEEDHKHILNLNAGLDFGVKYGVEYGYQFKAMSLPTVANIEYSFPSGDKFFDDFKTKMGINVKWFTHQGFTVSTKIQGVFRRIENDNVRLVNFGTDISGTVGYYRPKWFVATEVGFDKAIVTHFKHSQGYKDVYPNVANGWFEPATGGNFYYGLQTGFSFGRNDIYLKAGKVLTQDFKTTPILPFYAQLGYNRKF
jgi:hypothetical protein